MVKYNYITINGNKTTGSDIQVKYIPIIGYLYWGIPILIGIIVAVSGGF
jgi:hypothetical protein